MGDVVKGVTKTFIIFLVLLVMFIFISEYISQYNAINMLNTTTDMFYDCVIDQANFVLGLDYWHSVCNGDYNTFVSQVQSQTTAWDTVFNDLEDSAFEYSPTQYGLTFLPEQFLKTTCGYLMRFAMKYNIEGDSSGVVKSGHFENNSLDYGRNNYLNSAHVISNPYFEIITSSIDISVTPDVVSQDSDFYKTFLSKSGSNSGTTIDTDINNVYVDEIVVYEVLITFDYIIPYSNYYIREVTNTYGNYGTYKYRNVYFIAR